MRSAGERSAGLAALRDKGARDWPEPGDVEAFNAVFTASVQPMPEPGPPERDAAEARAATATTGEEDRPTVPDFKEPSEPTAPEMPEAKQEDLFD
ncbi:protein of unknown function [Candidatus Methylocalor cossyra]|uniref:Uncharacterized protein n=1 Tax=Candidatus Methylocalor cossyra TaxID=3108543 RepID=A0ABM9NKG4_9GAMM